MDVKIWWQLGFSFAYIWKSYKLKDPQLYHIEELKNHMRLKLSNDQAGAC